MFKFHSGNYSTRFSEQIPSKDVGLRSEIHRTDFSYSASWAWKNLKHTVTLIDFSSKYPTWSFNEIHCINTISLTFLVLLITINIVSVWSWIPRIGWNHISLCCNLVFFRFSFQCDAVTTLCLCCLVRWRHKNNWLGLGKHHQHWNSCFWCYKCGWKMFLHTYKHLALPASPLDMRWLIMMTYNLWLIQVWRNFSIVCNVSHSLTVKVEKDKYINVLWSLRLIWWFSSWFDFPI